MTIINQKRDTIVNFDKVQSVNIHLTNRKQICAWFSCNEDDKNSVLLGEYKNEERAKEILKDIFKTAWITNFYIMPEE